MKQSNSSTGSEAPNAADEAALAEPVAPDSPYLERFGINAGWAEEIEMKCLVDTHPLDTDVDNRFVQLLLSLGAEPVGAPWFCDAGWLSKLGNIPSVACGPGPTCQTSTVCR